MEALTFAAKNYMYDTEILLGILIVVVVGATLVFLLARKKKTEKDEEQRADAQVQQSRTLQLQAYERLALLTDRIALPNLIPRLNVSGATARELQMLLVNTIKEEFQYNISQQIYVSADAWSAVKNLKEQNLLVINQLAANLPENASSLDLAKYLLEYLLNDKRGTLHDVVGEVLSYEAKHVLAQRA